MVPLHIEALHQFLIQSGFEAKIQPETQQIYTNLKVLESDFLLFIRVIEQSRALQLLIFFPFPLVKENFNETARLLHLLNKDVDFPGFGMDESSNTLFYRMMLLTADMKISPELLEVSLETVQLASESLYPAIEAVASGKLSVDDILAQIRTGV